MLITARRLTRLLRRLLRGVSSSGFVDAMLFARFLWAECDFLDDVTALRDFLADGERAASWAATASDMVEKRATRKALALLSRPISAEPYCFIRSYTRD